MAQNNRRTDTLTFKIPMWALGVFSLCGTLMLYIWNDHLNDEEKDNEIDKEYRVFMKDQMKRIADSQETTESYTGTLVQIQSSMRVEVNDLKKNLNSVEQKVDRTSDKVNTISDKVNRIEPALDDLCEWFKKYSLQKGYLNHGCKKR